MTGFKAKKTTIYDLAELAGASSSAVSAVLNGSWKKRRIGAQLAEKILRLAEEQGYTVNQQASLLRRRKSTMIGMIVPKYDNRYFGSIVELFESMARERGLFPVITCTSRDPELEIEAARTMLSYQVDWIISTGATAPDNITEICAASGISTLNLDLPGTLAPSVITDNYAGAKELTLRILANCEKRLGYLKPLIFVGGRGVDHNTTERLRGFRDAHRQLGVEVIEENLLACGYSPDKAELAMKTFIAQGGDLQTGLFVNSTISLEGVMRWLVASGYRGDKQPVMGCFDWDPFVLLLGHDIVMVKQDVNKMLQAAFALIDANSQEKQLIEIPPIFPEMI
ncbi:MULTISPECIES: LacI family DNA-binding transcriptional regulator [Serratia]|uniref:Degradation activator n=1 Tax=Serratia fonticola TaxID=47917 RepID=A0A448SRS8_SERFO|nr:MULTISPECIES: LacI family DNA-binding transcriptional regulator [Serratia]AYM90379.1 LacI family DNA-binding transcriptional regulator [Serratia sp. 3ACOL1]MBL5826170.1 LacI family DNA-binding transcriptional regulator [Serratia fonticola]MBL5861209.1 LacI family DNA-binding transcriptional regulator [Serratia fonticola]MDK2374973.1 LacI family DNA-binding transcriptional regulator [Serratia fonticola]WMT12326.1 LacI family DNA-binding transcriptional regulator [Serratia fonticola]